MMAVEAELEFPSKHGEYTQIFNMWIAPLPFSYYISVLGEVDKKLPQKNMKVLILVLE